MSGSGLVNQAQLDASQISFSSRFNMVLQSFEDPIRQIAMELPSDAAVEEHDWLGSLPGLEPWLDDRKLSNLVARGFQIRNEDFSAGIKIHANDIKDDRLAIVRPRIDQFAVKAALHYGLLIVDALIQGFVAAGGGTFGPAYDGQSFFSDLHTESDTPGAPVQSNTSGTTPLSQASYGAARSAMWSLTDEVGDPLNIVPDHLLVGPDNEETALEITGAEVISNPAGTASITNVRKGTARVIISPRLIGLQAGHWFLMSFSQPVRPLILQINEPITSSSVIGDDATSGAQSLGRFMRKQVLFGAEGRHNVGYGLWQHIHGSSAP